MALQKTTEIPLNDKELALKEYAELIESDKIIMVVLGNSASIQAGVDLADELADTSPTGEKRWVMWVKNYEVLKEKLKPVLKKAKIIEDDTPYEDIKAFCLTRPERKALSRVHKNGAMDFVRLEGLFVEAERGSII